MPQQLDVSIGADSAQVPTAYIHTSDRQLYKRCRRKWWWMGKLGDNLEADEQPWYFWFGTGFHYAMEDFHGYNFYGDPFTAFRAYALACRRAKLSLPDNVGELFPLAKGMLEYYTYWVETCGRGEFETLWIDGVPQCEVTFDIDIPFDFSLPRYANCPFRKVVYRGTIDRVVLDPEWNKRLWLLDYKAVGQFSPENFDLNQQASAYCWAASVLYPGYEVAGFIFQEHKKVAPEGPRLLGTGKISTAKNQATTRLMYKLALENQYGSVAQSPEENIQYLNWLAEQESEHRDRYIKRSLTTRTYHRAAAEGTKIMLEAEEMLDINTPKYPTPTRDCNWDCPVQNACLSLDEGLDWETEIREVTHERMGRFNVDPGIHKPADPKSLLRHQPTEKEKPTWRHLLPDPQELPPLQGQ